MQLAVANFNHLRFLDNPCKREHFAIGQGVATESRDISRRPDVVISTEGRNRFSLRTQRMS